MTELNPDFRRTMLLVMPMFAVLTGMLLGLLNQLVTEREFGVLWGYKINGLSLTRGLFIPALTTGLYVLAVSLIFVFTAPVWED